MELHEVLKCELCGNMVEVLNVGGGEIVCCGKPMTILKSSAEDVINEKHVPVVRKVEGGIEVDVGSIIHPATEEHYIAWVELLADGRSYRQFIARGSEPKVMIHTDAEHGVVRCYCNLHGMWQKKF